VEEGTEHRCKNRMMYNLTDTPQFSGPNTRLGNSQFGVIATSQMNDPRIIELALKLIS
jgi:hypothetical protein